MDIIKLRKELDRLYNDVSNSTFEGNYTMKEAMFRIINYNNLLLTELINEKSTVEKYQTSLNKSNLDEHFMKGVYEIVNAGGTLNVDILNWYRNLYHKEESNTERGIMTTVINNILTELKYKDIELTSCYNLPTDLKEE